MESGVRKREPLGSDAIQLGVDINGQTRGGVRYAFLLTIFMRVVAALWMFRGLLLWRDMLMSEQEPFATIEWPVAAALVFFSVFDLVAAVGLWLATPWGGMLWIFAAVSGMIVALVIPDVGLGGVITVAADLTMTIAYFALSHLAARERDD